MCNMHHMTQTCLVDIYMEHWNILARLLSLDKCWDVTHEEIETYISFVKLFSFLSLS